MGQGWYTYVSTVLAGSYRCRDARGQPDQLIMLNLKARPAGMQCSLKNVSTSLGLAHPMQVVFGACVWCLKCRGTIHRRGPAQNSPRLTLARLMLHPLL